MGKIVKGILGGFSGLVGTVVGATWRGIDVMRSRPKKSNKPATLPQMVQRDTFALMMSFLGEIKDLIKLGFQSHTSGMTPFNAAFSVNMEHGITGMYPALAINYPQIVISKGGLRDLVGLGATSTEAAEIDFTWTNNTPTVPAGQPASPSATDKLTVCVYCPIVDEFAYVESVVARTAATYTMSLPANFSGEACHAWCFFVSANGKKVSDSEYISITVI